MKYIIKETFTTKRDTSIFSPLKQAENETEQGQAYVTQKLGKYFTTTKVNPPKRKKIDCPTDCGNTYVWINEIYSTEDSLKQVLFVECANTFCGAYFYVYQESVPE